MKKVFTFLGLMVCVFTGKSQIPVIAIDTLLSSSPSSFSYVVSGNTYEWGISPNDSLVTLNGFNAGSVAFTYASGLNGSIKLRRVNNVNVSGNFTVEWVQATSTGGTTYNFYSDYKKSLDTFLNSHIYNKGTDNLFDNTTAPNRNNIERLDWISSGAFSTPLPKKVGVGVFDKGIAGGHDPFCIAAITSLDGFGDPATYGKIVRVTAAKYGDPGPSVTYRIVQGTYPANLVISGAATQDLGGVFISLDSLGITANTPIYGYSLFANDLPLSATPADLVNYNNIVNFPTNTNGADGGLDLVAVTGFYISNVVLPVTFTSFSAIENNDDVNLKWAVENGSSVKRYEIERSEDGKNFSKINEIKNNSSTESNAYSVADNVASVLSNTLYYRIKQYDADGLFYYSKTIVIRRNNRALSIILFPNPVKENLYLNISSKADEKATISIFNAAGSRVMQQQQQLFQGNNSFTIDAVSKLSKGVYQLFVKLNSGRTIIKQFAKQ
ncbi:MAG: T9SS type A sorting domain-containing protein [Ginsengibacter sp.]